MMLREILKPQLNYISHRFDKEFTNEWIARAARYIYKFINYKPFAKNIDYFNHAVKIEEGVI